jgi:hypothetical protein
MDPEISSRSGATTNQVPSSHDPRWRDAMMTDSFEKDGPDTSRPACTCRRCGRELHPGRGELYVVSVLAVADPYPPIFTEEDIGMMAIAVNARVLAVCGFSAFLIFFRKRVIFSRFPCHSVS